MKKKKKKRLNKKRTLVFILFLYIICYFLYDLINSPIKHFEINGNKLVKDSEILRVSNLKDYPSIMRYTSNTIEKKIKSIELVNDVKVKKWFGHKIIINIDENKVLFYYKNINKIVLSNGNIIDNKYDIVGIPIFNNDIDKDIYNDFIKNFSKLNDNIIYEINSVEYYPQVSTDGSVISKKTIFIFNLLNFITKLIISNTVLFDKNKITTIIFIHR